MENTMNNEAAPMKTAAQEIRAALKIAFPGVKFSVTKLQGTGSVDVRWTDGPAVKSVEEIAEQWIAGSFDGMTDSYNYAKDRKPNAVRFVFCNREISPELVRKIRADLVDMGVMNRGSYNFDRISHQITHAADFRKAYKRIAIVDGAYKIVTE